ncbi:MAG: hypothetical protein ACK5MT_02670 [Actinomycetales bacterium]
MTRHRPRTRALPDEGSATPLTLALIACSLLLAGLLGSLVQVRAAVQRAEVGADLSALAARASAPAEWSSPGACPVGPRQAAVAVAEANQVQLVGCDALGDGSLVVVVAAPLPPRLSVLPAPQARARAG